MEFDYPVGYKALTKHLQIKRLRRMTIMARTRSLSSIETEISKVTAELQKAQEKVDELTQRLLELQEQKQSIEVKQIMDAFRRSGKSMQELLTFLDV